MIAFVGESIQATIDWELINIELFRKIQEIFRERHLNIWFTNWLSYLCDNFGWLIEMIGEMNDSLVHLEPLFITIGFNPGSLYSIAPVKINEEQSQLLGDIINMFPCACELKYFDFWDKNSINWLLYGDNVRSLGFVSCKFNVDEDFKIKEKEITCKMISFMWCNFYSWLNQPHQSFLSFTSALIDSKYSLSILDSIWINMDMNSFTGQVYMLDYIFALGRKDAIKKLIDTKLYNLSKFYSYKNNYKRPYLIMSSMVYFGYDDTDIHTDIFPDFNDLDETKFGFSNENVVNKSLLNAHYWMDFDSNKDENYDENAIDYDSNEILQSHKYIALGGVCNPVVLIWFAKMFSNANRLKIGVVSKIITEIDYYNMLDFNESNVEYLEIDWLNIEPVNSFHQFSWFFNHKIEKEYLCLVNSFEINFIYLKYEKLLLNNKK